MATYLVLEAANLFTGDDDPTRSNHLNLEQMRLPGVSENYVDILGGGSPVATEVNTHIEKMECPFTLKGWTPNTMTLIGTYQRDKQRFTANGGIRDRATGRLYRAQAVIWGRLGRAMPEQWQRGQNSGFEYAVRAITHYELIYAGRELWYWDYFTNTLRIGGVDIQGEMNSILGITGTGAGSQGFEVGGVGAIAA